MRKTGFWTPTSRQFKHSTADFASQFYTADCSMSGDSYINSAAPTTNYGTATILRAGQEDVVFPPSTTYYKFWFIPDLSGVTVGAVHTSTLNIFYNSLFSGGSITLNIYRVLRDVVESQVTWNIWKTSNNWATAGCGDSTNDYDGSVSLATWVNPGGLSDGDQISIELDHTEMTKYINGIYSNYGFIVIGTGGGRFAVASTNNATAGLRPKLYMITMR